MRLQTDARFPKNEDDGNMSSWILSYHFLIFLNIFYGIEMPSSIPTWTQTTNKHCCQCRRLVYATIAKYTARFYAVHFWTTLPKRTILDTLSELITEYRSTFSITLTENAFHYFPLITLTTTTVLRYIAFCPKYGYFNHGPHCIASFTLRLMQRGRWCGRIYQKIRYSSRLLWAYCTILRKHNTSSSGKRRASSLLATWS